MMKSQTYKYNRDLSLVRFFAKRYLFSKKSHALVNTISIISSLSVAIPTAALIILLSVFGGITSLVESLNSNFDSEIKISPQKGRFFSADSVVSQISNIDGIEFISTYIEDNALASYEDAQSLVTVRGVDTLYRRVVPIEQMMKVGSYNLNLGDINYAILGMGVAYNLGVNVNLSKSLELYVPSENRTTFLPTPSYSSKKIFPNSIFAIDAERDSKYVIVPLKFAQELFGRERKVSAVVVKSDENSSISSEKIETEIARILGGDYKIENRYAQNESVYKIMNGEKRMVFIISLFVIIIASFSLTGSLVMLLSDKSKQIEITQVIGATNGFIDKIFFTLGTYISLAGVALGVVLGVVITLIQQYFGIISIESETLLMESYPVVLSINDVAMVVVSVVVINFLIIFATVKNRSKTNF